MSEKDLGRKRTWKEIKESGSRVFSLSLTITVEVPREVLTEVEAKGENVKALVRRVGFPALRGIVDGDWAEVREWMDEWTDELADDVDLPDIVILEREGDFGYVEYEWLW